jgi:hypothetical protein
MLRVNGSSMLNSAMATAFSLALFTIEHNQHIAPAEMPQFAAFDEAEL